MIPEGKVFDTIPYSEGIFSVCYSTEKFFIIVDHVICTPHEPIFDFCLYNQVQI